MMSHPNAVGAPSNNYQQSTKLLTWGILQLLQYDIIIPLKYPVGQLLDLGYLIF